MRKHLLAAAAVAVLAALASAPPALADPISLSEPVTLTGQTFEWRSSYSSRASGTYGQYEVSVTAGETYEFETSSVSAGNSDDPYLYLVNSAGTSLLAADDDAGAGLNSRIVHTATSTGSILVRLRAYPRGGYGTCTLAMKKQASSGGTELEPGDVLTDQVFEWRSSFSSRASGTYGQYSIAMTGGTFYTFETKDASGAWGDTYLYLLNDDLAVVAADDDSGSGYQSRLTFRPLSDGTFYLRLRAYERGDRGTCALWVTAPSTPPGTALFPDLLTWRKYLEDVRVSGSGSSRVIRFSNAVANRGSGPLDVYGVVDAGGVTQAYQAVHNSDGSRTIHHVGTFSFAGHEDHSHWHYDEFAVYQLRDPDTGEVVAESGKVSFCLEDSVRYTAESISGAPSTGYYTCENQGISKGWADVYSWELDGQDIPLAGISDGTYDLVSTANPEGGLIDASDSNDAATIRITINGSSVSIEE